MCYKKKGETKISAPKFGLSKHQSVKIKIRQSEAVRFTDLMPFDVRCDRYSSRKKRLLGERGILVSTCFSAQEFKESVLFR